MVNYIRNKDRGKFPTAKIGSKGAALSELKGTIKYAKGKGVPVYDQRGNVKRGSFGYKEWKSAKR